MTGMAGHDPGISGHVRPESLVTLLRNTHYGQKQQAFLAFVLDQYVTQGVDELDADKLTPLLKLRYNAISNAIADLGDAVQVRNAFVGMQRYLYA